mmetsp:Transcript_19316/g.29328  ORF Transcript_19316/g.29328 Transcript_19316/m.29328 type:complete len:768 (+) Transcript_19316:86-2389(+)
MGCSSSKQCPIEENKPEVSVESNILDWRKLEIRPLDEPLRRKLSQRTFSTLFEEEGSHQISEKVNDEKSWEQQNIVESFRKRREMAKIMHEAAEYAEERNGASTVSILLEALKEVAPQVLEKRHLRKEKIDELRASGWPENLVVDQDYNGFRVPPSSEQINRDMVLELIRHIEKKQGSFAEKIHIKFMLTIVLKFLDHVRTQPTVVHVSTALTKGQCVVIGDLHGQLPDLLRIFHGIGFPSYERPFIFNGDLIDRGPSSLEILLIVAAFAIAEPYSVYVNRGNHEDFGVCGVYTFAHELETKYPKSEENQCLHEVIEQIFAYLPIACVIDRNILIIHGGLSDKIRDLDHLANIQRGGYKSLMTPALKGLFPTTKKNSPKNSSSPKNIPQHSVHDVLKDCLWSDPLPDDSNESICIPNDTRGAGVKFPKNITTNWLNANELGVLLRSHQCVDHGYEIQHDGKCLTLFSASNYYGHEHNDGAVLVLDLLANKNGGYIATYNVTITASSKDDENIYVQEEESISAFEKSALSRIHKTLLDHRRELVDAFEKRDPQHTGMISLDDWDEVMRATVPHLKLPWRECAPQFARTQDDNSVRYKHLLNSLRRSLRSSFKAQQNAQNGQLFCSTLSDNFDTKDQEQSNSINERFSSISMSGDEHQAEEVFRMRRELNLLFNVLDVDASGTLTRQDLIYSVDVLNKMNAKVPNGQKKRKFTKQDVDKLLKHLDVDGNGSITFAEFAATLMQNESTRDVLASPPTSPRNSGISSFAST